MLSFLAMRSWPAYELNREIRASLRLCWPRTERRIYQEPKNLVAHGLASATTETMNRRSRTIYSITDNGRAELAAWLERPTAPPLHEFEGLLRTGFAEFGTREALLANLEKAERDALELLRAAWREYPGYLEAVGVNPERLRNLALYAKYLVEYTRLIVSWSRLARADVLARPVEWPDDEVPRQLAMFTPQMLEEWKLPAPD